MQATWVHGNTRPFEDGVRCGRRLAGLVLTCVIGAFAVGAFAELTPVDWNEGDLDVAQGTQVTVGPDQIGKSNSKASVHGKLIVSTGGDDSSHVYYLRDSANVNGEIWCTLGENPGDEGVVEVDNAQVYAFGTWTPTASWRIGGNGGNGRFILGGDHGVTFYGRDIFLMGNAATTAERFEPFVISQKSRVVLKTVQNQNAKPLQITFTNRADVTARSYLEGYYGTEFFKTTNVGGDIVLRGQPNADICIQGWAGYGFKLFPTDANSRKACVRTEGDCDVEFDVGRSWIFLNAANFAWGHSGETRVVVGFTNPSQRNRESAEKCFQSFRMTEENVLPFGPQTGNMRLKSVSPDYPLEFDFYGKSQCMNGLIVGPNVLFVATNGPVRVSFGAEDADGVLSGVIGDADGAISYGKTGVGRLTVSNATVNALSVTGGTLAIAQGTVNRIGTLAITNATLEIPLGSGAMLEVGTWAIGENVTMPRYLLPSSGMSNVVFTTDYQPVPGAKLIKEGNNFLTCVTPADAQGMDVVVKGGVLRMGGAVCTNEFWRFIAKKSQNGVVVYDIKNGAGETLFSINAQVGFGMIGFFSPEGLACQSEYVSNLSSEILPEKLNGGQCFATDGYVANWSSDYVKTIAPEATGDPILAGGSAGNAGHFLDMKTAWRTENYYDLNASSSTCMIPNWFRGLFYTNAQEVSLSPSDASTWKIITWRRSANWLKPASYSLRSLVNNDRINVSDWELQSSPDGINWTTMDERSNQTYSAYNEPPYMTPTFNYTYNAHVPYLFSSLRANWRFDTFGSVEVLAGAILDLSELNPENIAITRLKVDVTAGAGTVRRFVPAANGRLDLTVADASAFRRTVLPLTVTDVSSEANLSTWSVIVNGEPLSDGYVRLQGDKLVAGRQTGFILIWR